MYTTYGSNTRAVRLINFQRNVLRVIHDPVFNDTEQKGQTKNKYIKVDIEKCLQSVRKYLGLDMGGDQTVILLKKC